MAPTKLKIAMAGLGRMGKRHALNLLIRTPRAELVAAFSPDETELAWARTELEPHGVKLFNNYDEMINFPGLQAVSIATISTVHAEETIKAIEKDLHVLCEKPLSVNIEITRAVIEAASKKPHLKVMCGFSRRFDASYRDARQKLESGIIGHPVVFRSQTCDKNNTTGFFLEYAKHCGGAFVDMSAHDIDLCLWFLGPDVVLKSISAAGIVSNTPGLSQYGDFDNGVGIVEFYGGQLAYFYISRTMAHGQEDTTEIIGTEGKLSINVHPQLNHVNIYTASGINREVPSDYFGRFEHAFTLESNEFVAAVLDNKELPYKFSGALRTVEIGSWLQESARTGKKIYFDESGKRIESA